MITENDLHESEHSIFTGVTVEIGSLVLVFSSGLRMLIQCPFKCEEGNCCHIGHGEDLSTCHLLFPYFNHTVELCCLLDGEMLKLFFVGSKYIYYS